MDVRERFQHAVSLVESGNYSQATSELTWLWNHMLDEDKSFAAVRSSYLISWMKRLMELHDDARVQFTAIRDNLTPYLEPGSTDYKPIMDWFALSNKLLADHDSIAAWVDEILASDRESLELRLMRGTIFSWLSEQGRWEDAGGLLGPGSVVAAEERLTEEREKYDESTDEEIRKLLRERRLKLLTEKYHAYHSANRIDESRLIKELMVELHGNDQAQTVLQSMIKGNGQ